jgi:hypothetical protein
MTTLTVDLEKIACDIALAPPVDGLALSPDARAVIDTAPKHTEDIDVRRVTCTPEIARGLIDYFNAAAARLQTRGELDRSTACAQAAEGIRRALAALGGRV